MSTKATDAATVVRADGSNPDAVVPTAMIDSPMADPVVRQCRGLVVDE